MSSFDEAFRREAAQQQSADAAKQSVENRRRRAAEAAIPAITQMLRDFARTLGERGVPPARFEVEPSRGFFGRRRQSSPDGYVVHKYMGAGTGHQYPSRLSLVTPDGQLWRYTTHPKPGSMSESIQEVGFVPVTVEVLLRGDFVLDWVEVFDDGRVGKTDSEGDFSPAEEVLAGQAQRLVEEEDYRRRRSRR